MDLLDLQMAEMEADINVLSADDWDFAREQREERYLYRCLQLILLENIDALPETK